MLPLIGNNSDLLEQLKRNWREANVDDQARAILELAEKLTRDPASVKRSDIEGLRAKGLSDLQILDVVLITSEMNFRVCPT